MHQTSSMYESLSLARAGRERKSSQKRSYGAAVVVAERSGDLAELGQVAVLEQRVAGMRREPAPEIGAQHRRHHRAVAAARLARDRAVLALGDRPVAAVHPGHDLVAEVGVVVAGRGRVEELAAAERRPRVDEDDDRRGHAAVGEQARPRARRPRGGTRAGSATCRSGR